MTMDAMISNMPVRLKAVKGSRKIKMLIRVATKGSTKVSREALLVSIYSSPLVYRRNGVTVEMRPNKNADNNRAGLEITVPAIFDGCANGMRAIAPTMKV